MSADDGATYYDQPVLKEPVWIWSVPAYFFAGGAGGALSLLGAVARAAGRDDLAGLVHKTRRLAVGAGATSTALLIADLGRPGRFLNMLRVFRPSSPMSLGSWVLAAYAPLATGAAIVPGRLGDVSGLAAGTLGLPLAGYTAVLLANTAVPAWHETRATLPPLFASSAVTAAASLLDLLPLAPAEADVVRRYGILGRAAELVAAEAVERDACRTVERVGRPYREGVSGTLWRSAKVLTGLSLALSLASGGSRHPRRRRLAGAFGVAGAVAVRFAVFEAGRASTRDPRATFELQRAAGAGTPPAPRRS